MKLGLKELSFIYKIARPIVGFVKNKIVKKEEVVMKSKLLGSKKFKAMVVGLILEIAIAVGLPESWIGPAQELLMQVVAALTGMFIAGQAIADHGQTNYGIEEKKVG